MPKYLTLTTLYIDFAMKTIEEEARIFIDVFKIILILNNEIFPLNTARQFLQSAKKEDVMS